MCACKQGECFGNCPCGCRHTPPSGVRYYRDRRGFVGGPNPEVHDASARVVLVIDPEDREQIEGLFRLVLKTLPKVGPTHRDYCDALQQALHSLAAPPTCGAALNIKGEHIGCDKEPGHDDQVHANREHEAIWQGWPL